MCLFVVLAVAISLEPNQESKPIESFRESDTGGLGKTREKREKDRKLLKF